MKKSIGKGSPIHSISPFGGRRIGRTPLRRCRICNFPNDTRSTGWAKEGEGISRSTTTVGGLTIGQFEITGGCAFCGNMTWVRGKPQKLPDDIDLPSDEYKNRR